MTGSSKRSNGGDGDEDEKLLGSPREPGFPEKERIMPNTSTTTRNSSYSSMQTSSPSSSLVPPGFGGDVFQLKDAESERIRDSRMPSSGNAKESSVLPYYSSADELETFWERERFKGGSSMTWALTERAESENRLRVPGEIDSSRRGFGFGHIETGRDVSSVDKEFERRVDRYSSGRDDLQRRGSAIPQLNTGGDLSSSDKEMEGRIDRYANSHEDSHSRGCTIPQLNSGRESTSVEKEMEGRVDRYASIRDSHSRDGEHGFNCLPSSTYDWRKWDRSSTTHGSSWSPPFFPGNASSQDSKVRFEGASDISARILSLQVSLTGATSLVLETGQDDVNHLSPPKKPRLGWGQGLAKYEKKKVGDCDDVPKSSPATRVEILSKTELQSEEESQVDRVSISGSSVTTSLSARALVPEGPSSDNLPGSTDGIGHKVEAGLGNDVRRANSSEGGNLTSPYLTGAHVEDVTCKTAVSNEIPGAPPLSPVNVSDQVEAPHLNRYLRLTRESDEAPGGQTRNSNDENAKPDPASGFVDDLSGWSKEAILLRVETVEGEIDSVEKELAKLAREMEGHSLAEADCRTADQGGAPLEVVSPLTENKVHDADAVDDPTLARSLLSLPSPSMIDSTNENITELMAPVSFCEESPVSSGTEQAHNEDLPPLKSSSACSGGTDHDGEVEVLKEITNDMPPEENRQLVGKELQVKHMTGSMCESDCESRDQAYQRSLVYSLIQDNRQLAKEAAAPFSNLLAKNASYDRPNFYATPEDSPVWRENVENHLKNQKNMQLRLAERKKLLKFKERVLAFKYRALKEEGQHGQFGICQRRDRVKAVRRWEVERCNATLSSQRSTLRLRPVLAGPGRLDAAQDEAHVTKKLMAVAPANHLRQDLKMPSMIIDERERCFHRFVSRNGLVEDPLSYEQERKAMNPWTLEEKKVFLEKFMVFNKNFSKIATFLEHKTTADCVEYYYRNQKSEDFERMRRQQLKKQRDYSGSGASYLATTTPGNNRNHRDVNATRVQALTLAAAAAYAASRDCTKALRGSSHKAVYDSRSLERTLAKPGCSKESKALSTPDGVLSGVSPGSVSGGTPSASRNCCEKPSGKIGSGFGSPASKCIASEPFSGSRGVRTTLMHSDPSRMECEEVESQWTDFERELFLEAVSKYGKEYRRIADHVGSKSQTQCKNFFSKTRKRFKLDELVEQSQGTCLVGLGLGGVSMKIEFIFDEKVGGLVELAHLSTIEATGVQGNENEVLEEKLKLDMAEANVADGLMLLGQALEAEVAPLPSKVSLVPSAVSDLPSKILDLPPKFSDLPSKVPDLLSEVAELPSMVSNMPPKVSVLPSQVSDLPSNVSDLPSMASDLPSKVSDMPPGGSDSQQKVSDLPSKESNVLSQASNLPSTKSGDTAVPLTGVDEHESVKLEVVLKKSTGSVALDEQKHAEQNVKIEQINDDSQVSDGLIKAKQGAVDVSGMKLESEMLESTGGMRGESVKDAGAQPIQLTEKPSRVLVACAEDNNFGSVVVKAEPVVPLDMGGACLPSILPPTAQTASLHVTAPTMIHCGQPRERGSRIISAGEVKPRREPTSWTQEEKEKFAEIIRRHGKDWSLLHESLPAKSLTQIKTYFQNSKAKLGFLSSDGLTNISARGTSARKRKAEESDTSSNAGSAGQISNPKVSLSSEDVSQKVIASPMMSIGTNIGTPVVGGDGLGYPHFTQSSCQPVEDPSVRDIQKIIRRMCSGNEYPSQSPMVGGLMPLFQPGVFPTANTQQPLLMGGQKQVVVGHQPQQQSLPSQVILQQQQLMSQMTPSQRQLLSKVVQQLHQHQHQHQQQLQQQQLLQQQQQQHQTSQVKGYQSQQLAHQLKQQVTQIAAKQQQQQQQQLAQVAKHIQPQLLQHHVQQALPLASGGHQQQVVSRPNQTGGQQQPQAVHSNRVHNPSPQQHAFLQQQFLQQHKHQLLLQRMHQEQMSQQIQQQLQTQKELQHQPHLQQLQQIHQLQIQKEYAQQQVQQQQQQSQVQQQVQQQVEQSLGFLRGPFQSLFRDADTLARQSEMMEKKFAASKLGLLPREDLQQLQTQKASQSLAQQQARTSSSEPQRLRLGDVKLFGQSLLSQPPSNAEHPSMLNSQKLRQPITPASAVPMGIPSKPLSKTYGKDPVLLPSAFGRAGGSVPSGGHSQSWPVTSTGSVDLWTSMIGGLPGVVAYKNEDSKSELFSVHDAVARMTAHVTREVHENGSEDMSTQHGLEHVESGRAPDLKSNKAISGIVCGTDELEVLSEAGRECSRMEPEWRSDLLQPTNTGSARAFTRVAQQGAPTLVSQATINESFAVIDALSASADKRSAQGGARTIAQGGGNDQLVQRWEVLRRESVNDGISGSGAATSALKKLLSAADMSQLSEGVFIDQPHTVQANLVNSESKTSWTGSLATHATNSQLVYGGPSFQSGVLLHTHIGPEELSRLADSKTLEIPPGGNV